MQLQTLAHALRMLSVDAVELAQSGHPGMPLGMADIATVLWQKFLKHNPSNPRWFDRDRFVLSNGHGSILLYALLHMTGYALTIKDIQQFRQLHSKTPGHPECTETPGVETTTGPLGQGLANAVGMALAEQLLAAEFNQPDLTLVNHHTYAFVGDGCLMEGLSHEACSLAGSIGLSKLIVFYDANGISIDGPVASWFNEDTAKRFAAYHWQVIGPINGHDMVEIEAAIITAQQDASRPSLIICHTTIGFGSSKAGSAATHGAPLGADDIAVLRQKFAWPHPPFMIPDAIYAAWNHMEQGQHDEQEWLQTCHTYQIHHPARYHEFLRRVNGDLPDDFPDTTSAFIQKCFKQSESMATRKASQVCLEHFARRLPEMLGGSADLTSSNNTDWSGSVAITAETSHGNYLHYGVREFGMAAVMNGLAVHGGFIPYGGTFLVFADYARNAIRLSALMKQRVIYVLTHDSIGLGEDGPTHQPIEHAAMLRLTPNVKVWRPADLAETAAAWQQALLNFTGPTCLLLSRQALPALSHTAISSQDIAKGAYILLDAVNPEVLIMATGSEVHVALAAGQAAKAAGIRVRIISMPCIERFMQQPQAYQDHVLPSHVRKRIAIEAGASGYWYRFVGLDGIVLGIDQFGASAPATDLYSYFGLTQEHLMNAIVALATGEKNEH